MKKCLVSVRYGGPMEEDVVWFDKVCSSPSETYEVVAKIIERNKLMYPDQQRTKDDYLDSIVKLFAGCLTSSENHIFRIKLIEA